MLAWIAVLMGAMQLGITRQNMTTLHKARQAAVDVLATISRKPPVDAFSENGERLTAVRGEVELVGVTFAYPVAPTANVCDGYSLRVEPGQVMALCGPSGSGKSTVIALLERFYDPQQGQVLLDGVDIRTLNVRWLRQQLGLVAQEPVLFTGTVAENIEYGKEGATRDEVMAAARMADAHDFITQVGLSLHTSSQKKQSLPFGNEPAPLYAPVLCARFTHQYPPPLPRRNSSMATTQTWGAVVLSSREVKSSGSPSRARWCVNPQCYCSMRPRQRSIMKARGLCRRQLTS